MKAKTFEAVYNLTDFKLYMEGLDMIVELVLEYDNIDFVRKEFDDIFAVKKDSLIYVFSGYRLEECEEIGEELIRVKCVKRA